MHVVVGVGTGPAYSDTEIKPLIVLKHRVVGTSNMGADFTGSITIGERGVKKVGRENQSKEVNFLLVAIHHHVRSMECALLKVNWVCPVHRCRSLEVIQ